MVTREIKSPIASRFLVKPEYTWTSRSRDISFPFFCPNDINSSPLGHFILSFFPDHRRKRTETWTYFAIPRHADEPILHPRLEADHGIVDCGRNGE